MVVKSKKLLAGILAFILVTGTWYQSAYAINQDTILTKIINCVVLTIGIRSLVNSIKSDYNDASQSSILKGVMISGGALTVIVIACLMKKDIAEILRYLSTKLQ